MPATHELTILQLNDSHAYLDLHQEISGKGAHDLSSGRRFCAYRDVGAADSRAERPGGVLFCDGGDALHGTAPAVRTHGRAVVPSLNALGLTATTAHWEFAYGPPELRHRADELTYPLLACNVYDVATEALAYPSHTITEIAGVRIGIIGLASNIVDKTMPPHFSVGIAVHARPRRIAAADRALRDHERVDLIVLLSHLGFPQDLKLLDEVAGVDVCLSAHTHNRLDHPVRAGGALVIQSGCHGSFLGRLDLTVERGRVVACRHQLLTVEAEVPADPQVAELVRAALAADSAELGEVVGTTAIGLDRASALESTMDNLLLDALRTHTGAQLAFSNGWRYGAPVPPGPITRNDLYNMVPMDPPVATVTLTGEEVLAMLEENLERTYAADPYRQMGGYVKRCLGLRAYVNSRIRPGSGSSSFSSATRRCVRRSATARPLSPSRASRSTMARGARLIAERVVGVLTRHLARPQGACADWRGTFTIV